MATRAAQQALGEGRVVLLRAARSGVTEVGVICGDAPDAPAGSSGGSSAAGGGGGRGLDAFFGGGKSGGGGGAAAEDGGGDEGRKYAILYLHRPSALDPPAPEPAAQPAGGAGVGPAAAAPLAGPQGGGGGDGGLPGEPMLRLKKKVSTAQHQQQARHGQLA